MVIDKMLEYFQDLKRYYDDKKWGKFYDNYRNDPEEYEGYSNYFHNSYDDYEEAARDLCSEIREYMDLVWNEIPEDQVKLFDDGEKHNVREWLDETSRMFWNKLDNLTERETYGFLLQGYKMLKWIENAGRKTPDEFYGKYTGGQMPYYLGESRSKNSICGEREYKEVSAGLADNEQLAFMAHKLYRIGFQYKNRNYDRDYNFKEYLQWRDFTNFGKYPEFDWSEFYDQYEAHHSGPGPDNPYVKKPIEVWDAYVWNYLRKKSGVNARTQESDKTYKAKASGKWLSGNKLVKDEKDADTFESKTEPTQRLNQMKKDGKLNKNAKITVIDEALKNLFDEMLNEAITDFDKSNRGMYRYAKRKHDETKAIRKVSKEPYWVHPEGVAKIIMEHGGSDIEIKAGMAHDLLEDTGCTYDDLVEKFGEKVASIVKEVTNDKAEIEKVGKEKYISEELVRLSPEALTVKLSDMLYNMKDSPTESNYKRMRNNVTFLMMNRELSGIHCRLVDEILEV